MMFRASVLGQLGGLDERFFYHFEEVDLCYRTWEGGWPIVFCPDAEITHLGGQSVGRFPVRFALETYRSRYRYFFKHFAHKGVRQIRWVSLTSLTIRWIGYSLKNLIKPSESISNRLKCYRALLVWNWRLNPARFISDGTEPESGYAPLAPPPQMTEWSHLGSKVQAS